MATHLDLWRLVDDDSSVFRSCAWGDAAAVEAALADVVQFDDGASGMRRVLEQRESSLRKPPLHAAIAGALLAAPGCADWPLRPAQRAALRVAPPDFARVSRALLDAGARADAKDILGNSALHAAAGSTASAASLAIARLLVERGGADVRVRNRLGYPVLFAPAVRGRRDVVALLLALGADPADEVLLQLPPGAAGLASSGPVLRQGVADVCALRGQPELAALLRERPRSQPTAAAAVVAAAAAEQLDCAACGGVGARMKCGRCRGATYCSAACQRQHWPKHKPSCVKKKSPLSAAAK